MPAGKITSLAPFHRRPSRARAMFRKSIKQKIVGIAAGLIVLAVITSILSMVMAARVGHLLDELTNRYVPAYGDLARMNVRSAGARAGAAADDPSLALMARIHGFRANPPAAEWDGAWHLERK